MCLLNQAATCPKGFDDVQKQIINKSEKT
jgi:hypothetical protein